MINSHHRLYKYCAILTVLSRRLKFVIFCWYHTEFCYLENNTHYVLLGRRTLTLLLLCKIQTLLSSNRTFTVKACRARGWWPVAGERSVQAYCEVVGGSRFQFPIFEIGNRKYENGSFSYFLFLISKIGNRKWVCFPILGFHLTMGIEMNGRYLDLP